MSIKVPALKLGFKLFRAAVPFFVAAMLLVGVPAFMNSAFANTIYTISLPPAGDVTVSGTITTNGNLGTLTVVDFLDWDVTVSSPSLGSNNITFANTTNLVRLDDIFATVTTLFITPPAVFGLESPASGPNCSNTFVVVTPVPPGTFAEQFKVCTTLGFTAPQRGLPLSGVELARGGVAARTPITIDIKPGSDPNCFNINGHGVVPVAILGASDFEVNDVDVTTLLFGGLDVRIRGNKGPLCGWDYINDDGLLDLVCHFEDSAASWAPGAGEATLTGELYDGTPFEGTDSICIVP